MALELEFIGRLILAALVGGVIGYERQAHNKSAGLRTHMLVSVGSCLIMILSIQMFRDVEGLTNADPARLAAQVVSGIGFLGAGSIIKEGPTVNGLTTAASLWVVAGLGLAVGSGYYVIALATTIICFLTLTFLGRVEKKYYYANNWEVVVIMKNTPAQLGSVLSYLVGNGITIKSLKVEPQESVQSMKFLLMPEAGSLDIIKKLEGLPGVLFVKSSS
ncbi:MAG: MgtC/SapB family protein [Pelosinus sp.]|nr:MgtC/SapB family protein [Pelosinus sp.]